MAANMSDLVPDFRRKAEQLLRGCRQRGVEMRPIFTLRTPFEQAKLWRQLRIEEVRKKFRSSGMGEPIFSPIAWRALGLNTEPTLRTHLLDFPGINGGKQWIASGSLMEKRNGQQSRESTVLTDIGCTQRRPRILA